jgi:signal transduction histidine kinase
MVAAEHRPETLYPEPLGVFLEYLAQAIENAYLIFQLRQQNVRLELMMTKLQNTQSHLKRAEKMAFVGKLATAVAHEMRNPLTVIGTTLQLVFEKMPAGHPEQNLYEMMIAKVRSVDQTIKELMTLARPVQIKPKAMKLDAVIAEVAVFVSKKYASRELRLETDLPADLPEVRADSEQLQRVLLNLLLNAFHFLPKGGCVHLQARHAPGSPQVRFLFSDNGPGISAEHRAQIFEPFFSTRPEGTGLGMFMVKYLLEEMNSSIELVSLPGEGAAFLIHLPVVSEPTQTSNSTAAA